MPFTPYHFGINASLGLILKKWLDVPALVLVNVAIDSEVLYFAATASKTYHRHRFFHTYLGAAIVGIVLALMMFPFRKVTAKLAAIIKIPAQTNIFKLIASAVLGAWLHVFIDSFTHWDMRPLSPFSHARHLYRKISEEQIIYICIAGWILAILIYLASILHSKIKNAPRSAPSKNIT